MKAIIFLLSFMFVSCVTANTESRELSGVNPEKETLAIEDNPSKVMLAHSSPCSHDHDYDYPDPDRPAPKKRKGFWGWLFGSLDDPYEDIIINKEGVKVASYGDLNYFELLEEIEETEGNFFKQLSPLTKNPAIDNPPLMLAVDYDTCVKCCIHEGGSSSQCHRVCEE